MGEFILKERDLRETIAQAINRSGLPAIMIKPVLNDFIIQVTTLEQQQYEQAVINKQEEKNKEKEEQNDKLQEQSEYGNTAKRGESKLNAKNRCKINNYHKRNSYKQ